MRASGAGRGVVGAGKTSRKQSSHIDAVRIRSSDFESNSGLARGKVLLAALVAALAGMLPNAALAQYAAEPEDAGSLSTAAVKRPASTIFERADLERSAASTVAEFLRSDPLNSFGSRRPQSGSDALGFAGVALRGLGEARSLVLIDGQRRAVAPGLGQAVNLNSIPLAAVQRIEIHTGAGALAIGSEAAAGVINIITRRAFDGVDMRLMTGFPSRRGGDTESASVTMGSVGERGSLLSGASYAQRGLVNYRDRDFSSVGISTFANNFMRAVPVPNAAVGFSPGGFLNHPTNGSTVPGGCFGAEFQILGSRCLFDFTRRGGDEAESRQLAAFSRANYEINEDWSSYFDASLTRSETFGREPPQASFPWPRTTSLASSLPFIPVGSPNHPAVRFPNAGYDAAQPVFLRHRFVAAGTLDSSADETSYDMLIGFRGRIGEMDLALGLRRSEATSLQVGRGFIVGEIAQSLIANGSYDIYAPYANSRTLLDRMTATINRDSSSISESVFSQLDMGVFSMAGGEARLLLAAEARFEDYSDRFDSLTSSGLILGERGPSAAGERDNRGLSAALSLPILGQVQVDIATRWDDYSGLGSNTASSASLVYRAAPAWSLHAGYGRGFHAPDLAMISIQTAAETILICDPLLGLPGLACSQFDLHTVANPALRAETSEQLNLGLAWQPIDSVAISLNFYDLSIGDRIIALSHRQLLLCTLGQGRCPAGVGALPNAALPPQARLGLGLARAADGTILYGQTGFANFGSIDSRGLDLDINLQFDLGNWGNLRSGLRLSQVQSYRLDGGTDQVGNPSFPEIRGQWLSDWALGDFSLAWTTHYIDSTLSGAGLAARQGEDDFGLRHQSSSWAAHDLQLAWNAAWSARLVLGVSNLADKGPVLDTLQANGYYDPRLYDSYGRVPYLRYQQSF